MNQKQELRDRLDAKRKELEARLHELRADASSQTRAREKELEEKLARLKEDLQTDWNSITETVAARLNKWFHD